MKAIILFYIFMFAPRFIDTRSPKFWQWAVDFLNKERAKSDEGFYLAKIGKIYIRDPHSFPIKSHFTYANWHPFCYKFK